MDSDETGDAGVAGDTPRRTSSLFYKLSLPVFGLIVAVIVLLTTAASYILIRIQNDHTLRMAEQSMKFVYRNVWYQFTTMDNVSAFVLSNPSIDNLVENQYANNYEAIGDFYELQTHLQNLSLLSLLHDFGPDNAVKTSYTVSMALEPTSNLFTVSPAQFHPGTGIFQATNLVGQEWYSMLKRKEKQTVWWGQTLGSQDMIYSARPKNSFKNGRQIGTVIVGADTSSIRGVIGSAPIDQGWHVLLDDGGRVIYSDRDPFMKDMNQAPYIKSLNGKSGSLSAGIGGEQYRVIYDTFDNGWKLVALVPESHIGRYTFAISAVGAAIAAGALLLSGLWLRRAVIRVTVPISRLVNAMQRREVVNFEEPMPRQDSGIYEVDELNGKFSSMLVTIRGLIEKSYAEEIEKRQLQLELLQAQINPHFLYNTLDLINCRAIMAGDQETSRVVRSLANVFRYGLNKGETWIALEDEVRQVEAYLDIQKQMMDDLEVEIHLPDQLRALPVVHLILQPLAENCIVHGFAERTKGCRIVMTARMEAAALILRVEDNGAGADAVALNRRLALGYAEDSAKQTGYGTLNVHRRIALNCKGPYGLRYIRVPEGTCVEAVLPGSGMPESGARGEADTEGEPEAESLAMEREYFGE